MNALRLLLLIMLTFTAPLARADNADVSTEDQPSIIEQCKYKANSAKFHLLKVERIPAHSRATHLSLAIERSGSEIAGDGDNVVLASLLEVMQKSLVNSGAIEFKYAYSF